MQHLMLGKGGSSRSWVSPAAAQAQACRSELQGFLWHKEVPVWCHGMDQGLT
jgi:hypothetical protein